MKKSSKIILIVVIVILLLVIGVGGYLLISKMNEVDEANNQISELKNEIANTEELSNTEDINNIENNLENTSVNNSINNTTTTSKNETNTATSKKNVENTNTTENVKTNSSIFDNANNLSYTNNIQDDENGKIALLKLGEERFKTENKDGYYIYTDNFSNNYYIKSINSISSKFVEMGNDNWAALFKCTIEYTDKDNNIKSFQTAVIVPTTERT